jgi:nucleotidyltransferase substrate binding protein (TIGR01987 family)
MDSDKRWIQRFENFEKAFHKLSEAIEQFDSLDDLSKEGMIQRFEYTFELAWKTAKDYLEYKEVEVKYPRDTIKQAFKHELIDNGEIWMEMLNQRNLLTHTYDETNFNKALDQIRNSYFPQVKKLYDTLKDEARNL